MRGTGNHISRLAAIIAASPLRLTPNPAEPYSLPNARPAHPRYFGNDGLQGALIFERPAGPDGPSLEADFHVVLLR